MGDFYGKENLPAVAPGPKVSTKGHNQGIEKKKRTESRKNKEVQEQLMEGPAMDQAFDRLLVRLILEVVFHAILTKF